MNLSNVADALKIYDGVRRPFANNVVERSRTAGFIYEFNQPGLGGEEEAYSTSSLKAMGEEVYRQWSWHWLSMPEEDWARAEKELEEVL